MLNKSIATPVVPFKKPEPKQSFSNETVGDRIKSLRKSKLMTQDTLEELSGVQRTTIIKVERNQTVNTKDEFIRAMARPLGSTFEYLKYGIQDPLFLDVDVRTFAMQLQKMPIGKREKIIEMFKVFRTV